MITRGWHGAIAAAAALGVVGTGCKTDDAKPTPRVKEPSQPRPAIPPAGDGGDGDAPPPARPLDLARVQELEPSFDGATVLSPARMHQADQARQTWCMAGDDARALATAIADELSATGWTDVASRGTAERAAAAGTRDGIRISISVGGRDTTCPGLVASAVYAGPNVTLPVLAPGERIH